MDVVVASACKIRYKRECKEIAYGVCGDDEGEGYNKII